MRKYEPLANHLEQAARPCQMTFAEVERLVGDLPPSARTYRAWWANDRSHVQALAWLEHGRLVDHVDLERGIVRFS